MSICLLYDKIITGDVSCNSDSGWGPYAYFRAVEDLRANSTSGQQMSAVTAQAMEAQVMTQRARENGDALQYQV